VAVGGVVAGLEHDGVGRGEAGEGVDVGVGVVALQVAVLQPEGARLRQRAFQRGRDLFAAKSGVALVQAAPRAEQGAGAVGFDAAALEGEIDALVRRPGQQARAMNLPPQAVKWKSSSRRPPFSRRVIGPESRSQVSS
jgi:hypothetical protein